MTTHALLDLGVERGIITADQRAQLQTLLSAVEASATPSEAERSFNGIAVAYAIGAIVVLFAFGWFMIDRWKVLGDGGVLLLSLAYAAIFLLSAHVMARQGFRFARGVTTLLAIGMAPIAMWALLRWAGLWTPELDRVCGAQVHPFAVCQGQPLAIELAAVAAALLALRQMAFSPYVIPIAVVAVTLPERLLREMAPGMGVDGALMGWRWVIIASALAAVAYTVNRRQRDEDYAGWLWLSSAVAAWFGCFMLFQADHSLRWYLAPVSLLVITASVILRRRVLLIIGLFGVFGFLAWLAFDVFKVTTAFPLVLATIGIAIIVLTVWIQKQFPGFIRRVSGDPSAVPHFPGGALSLLAPALLGVLMMQDATRLDRERMADRRSRAHAMTSRNRARRDSLDAARGLHRVPAEPPAAAAQKK